MIEVEDGLDASSASIHQHLLSYLERIEVGMAVARAQNGQVRQRRGLLDLRIRVLVPFRSVDVLGDEDGIVDADFASGRSAEVADEFHAVAGGAGGDEDAKQRGILHLQEIAGS